MLRLEHPDKKKNEVDNRRDMCEWYLDTDYCKTLLLAHCASVAF